MSFQLKSKLQASQTQSHASPDVIDDDTEELDDPRVVAGPSEAPSQASSEADVGVMPPPCQRPPQTIKGRSRARPQPAATGLVETLNKQQADNLALQTQIRGILEPAPVSPESMYAMWLGKMAEKLHPSLTQRFYAESMRHMMGLLDESQQLQPQQYPQQPYQRQQGFQPVTTAPGSPTPFMRQQRVEQQQSLDHYTNFPVYAGPSSGTSSSPAPAPGPPGSNTTGGVVWDTLDPTSGQAVVSPGPLNLSAFSTDMNFSGLSGLVRSLQSPDMNNNQGKDPQSLDTPQTMANSE